MSNLTELKSLKDITDLDEIEISDLYEKDEDNMYFLEYIIEHNIIIKNKNENIILLREIVGDELVDLLDNFYKINILKLDTNIKIK